MKLYVASSWRNPYQQNVVAALREAGHEVYDFMHPPGGDHLGFSWADVDPAWQEWSTGMYREALDHPIAVAGFESDFGAMEWADGCVLLLPCGRSAHIEAGWFAGAGKPLWIVLDGAEFPPPFGPSNPELMYRMAGVENIVHDLTTLVAALAVPWSWCSCRGRRWVDDENWQPDDPRTWRGDRAPGDGLIPCGSCNFAGWDTPVGVAA